LSSTKAQSLFISALLGYHFVARLKLFPVVQHFLMSPVGMIMFAALC